MDQGNKEGLAEALGDSFKNMIAFVLTVLLIEKSRVAIRKALQMLFDSGKVSEGTFCKNPWES